MAPTNPNHPVPLVPLDLTINDDTINVDHALTLVGKLLSAKAINFRAITTILGTSWNLGSNVTFQSLDKLTFTCSFKFQHDKDRILASGSWAIKGTTINFQPWPPHLNLTKIDFSQCPFWVQIHDLPPNRFNLTNAMRLGDYIGSFVALDETQPIHCVKKFLRVRILVDTTAALRSGCQIVRENGLLL